MKRWLVVWLLSTGLAAQPPEPLLVRFDCQPPVESVSHHQNHINGASAVSREQENVFRFSVDAGPYVGDLSEHLSRFELSGHGFKGSASLDVATARQLSGLGQAYHVTDWHSTSYGAQIAYMARRYSPLGGRLAFLWPD